MGRGESYFRATKDSFDRVLGPRRGLTLSDSLAADTPSERALALFQEIGEQLSVGDEALALEELNRWPSQVDDKPLLTRLADDLADSRIECQFSDQEPALRQLASDLDIVPQWAETLVEKDGLIHLWPAGTGVDGLEVESDETAVCGEPLTGFFRAERGSWLARPEAQCKACDGCEHLPECSEAASYAVFDSDIDRDRREEAISSLRFALSQQLAGRGRLEKEQLALLADEAIAHADYQALARQAERNRELVLARLFPDRAAKPARPIHWYNHLRAAGERSGRSAERRQLLRASIESMLEE